MECLSLCCPSINPLGHENRCIFFVITNQDTSDRRELTYSLIFFLSFFHPQGKEPQVTENICLPINYPISFFKKNKPSKMSHMKISSAQMVVNYIETCKTQLAVQKSKQQRNTQKTLAPLPRRQGLGFKSKMDFTHTT